MVSMLSAFGPYTRAPTLTVGSLTHFPCWKRNLVQMSSFSGRNPSNGLPYKAMSPKGLLGDCLFWTESSPVTIPTGINLSGKSMPTKTERLIRLVRRSTRKPHWIPKFTNTMIQRAFHRALLFLVMAQPLRDLFWIGTQLQRQQ